MVVLEKHGVERLRWKLRRRRSEEEGEERFTAADAVVAVGENSSLGFGSGKERRRQRLFHGLKPWG